jgi:hypothetical protein
MKTGLKSRSLQFKKPIFWNTPALKLFFLIFLIIINFTFSQAVPSKVLVSGYGSVCFYLFLFQYGQLGTGNSASLSTPVQLTNWNTTTQISAGTFHSMMIDSGLIYGFGESAVIF